MDMKSLYHRVEEERESMLDLWKRLVNIDCGSQNKAGITQVSRIIADFLADCQIPVHYYHNERGGDTLVAPWGDMTRPFIVFLGHMDTVFQDGTVHERPFTIRDGQAFGPGVLDMKGGIVIALYTLKILGETGYSRFPIKLILTGDEENGHRYSQAGQWIVEECRHAHAAFNFETGFCDNSVVVERKGCLNATLTVTGKGAHAGNNPQEGRSAIREMAHKVLALESLTDFQSGNTVNVGVIQGGTVPNAVSEQCEIVVDLRFVDEVSKKAYIQKIQDIAHTVYEEGTTGTVEFSASFDAMARLPATMELFSEVNALVQENGFAPLIPKKVGGGSDSAYAVAAGVPTLCAMGVQGTGNHTVDERADVASLFTRTKMMLAIMMGLK